MQECVANVFQGCAIYAGILTFPVPFLIPFLLSPYFSPFSVLLSLLLSPSLCKWSAVVTYRWRSPQLWFPKEKSCSLSISPFSFPFCFLLSPFFFPLSLLLTLSLYKWNAAVTYRWRNPQCHDKECVFLHSLQRWFASVFLHCSEGQICFGVLT